MIFQVTPAVKYPKQFSQRQDQALRLMVALRSGRSALWRCFKRMCARMDTPKVQRFEIRALLTLQFSTLLASPGPWLGHG